MKRRKKKNEAQAFLAKITADFGEVKGATNVKLFLDEVKNLLPNFIFFSDFLDILPFELPLADASKNKPVNDFAKVAGLDLNGVVETTNRQLRRNILSKHSASITGDFMGYWGQNELDLLAEADGDNLRLGVKEAGNTIMFKPEQRSKGFQWFLSFYLRLNAEKDITSIILIDEPGLYLHAKAQKDVMKVFEEISRESQVIFSTHSPYLIDVHRLDRVRLVIKDDKNGTKVENKIHKNADAETLTPIITAVGLDISNDFSIVGKRNVLLEGISDYYFFRGVRSLLSSESEAKENYIPCVGAPKIPFISSLLLGWDLEFLAVLDNDSEGKRIAKELAEKLAMPSKKIVPVSNTDGEATEDLFTFDDFNQYVLEDEKNSDSSVTNSRFLKTQQLDKVLLAKKFFEKANENKSNVKLSTDTIKNFNSVFNAVSSGFKNEKPK